MPFLQAAHFPLRARVLGLSILGVVRGKSEDLRSGSEPIDRCCELPTLQPYCSRVLLFCQEGQLIPVEDAVGKVFRASTPGRMWLCRATQMPGPCESFVKKPSQAKNAAIAFAARPHSFPPERSALPDFGPLGGFHGAMRHDLYERTHAEGQKQTLLAANLPTSAHQAGRSTVAEPQTRDDRFKPSPASSLPERWHHMKLLTGGL